MGTITKQMGDGNYLATGAELFSSFEVVHYVKQLGYLYREVEIYQSLVAGKQYGRWIETTHRRDFRFNDPGKEAKPTVVESKCTRLK